jgi:cobalt-precorrin-5B (C1)-methyltransferase
MKREVQNRLRAGFTTGSCAAAAARGAALMLRDQLRVDHVTLRLPAGMSATFRLEGQEFSPSCASCFVVKDAGDDPDITNGAEIHALVTLPTSPTEGEMVVITGGKGIGRATKPGLAVAPGEWAINPVPRQMIAEAAGEVFPGRRIQVRISIPDGEQRALKTLNARLGILGGLSILGTTGIVRPVSAKAWTDTIDTALDVARACGCTTAVFSTGRTSELAAQLWFKNRFKVQSSRFEVKRLSGNREPKTLNPEPGTLNQEPLPEEAFVMMGDHVAHALRSARERGFLRPTIACQYAKLVKIACGYENTHAAASDMDLARLRQWAVEAALPPQVVETIAGANTAREIAVSTGFHPGLLALTARKALQASQSHAAGAHPLFLVADYSGRIVFHSFPEEHNG